MNTLWLSSIVPIQVLSSEGELLVYKSCIKSWEPNGFLGFLLYYWLVINNNYCMILAKLDIQW